MKLKVKTPDRIVVGFTRRELLIIGNCLHEACHGLLLDRFVPAREELLDLSNCIRTITESQDFFKIKTAV